MSAAKTPEDQELNGSVPDFSSIVVKLTYPNFDTMIFTFRRSLGPGLRKLQQEFFAKTKDEQDKEQQTWRVTFLADLLKKRPENVPQYPESDNIKQDFIQYFSSVDMDDVVDHLWTSYQAAIYPKELTSMLSES